MSSGVIDLALQGRLDVLRFFERHLHGDWGNVPLVLGVMNEVGLQTKDRLFSAFAVDPTLTLWIVTRLDRRVTTLLLPTEYDSFRADLTA